VSIGSPFGPSAEDFSLPSSAGESVSVSLSSFFEPDDFRLRFFGGSASVGGGVVLTFSLILVDRLGVSPVPQSNSDMLGFPGCAFRYFSSCFLELISSPVGETNTISFFLGDPTFLGKYCRMELKLCYKTITIQHTNKRIQVKLAAKVTFLIEFQDPITSIKTKSQ
jgi:hypothetical protein